jgi:sodium-dependent phosphate transporter
MFRPYGKRTCVQVFTAMCNSFAHGSNDVANSIGPFAGIYAVWQCTCVESKSDVPVWCAAWQACF